MTLTLVILTLLAVIPTTEIAAAAITAQPKRISPQRQNVVNQLNAGLAGTPMQGTGRSLEAAGWKWRVHPAFMAGVAGIESAWGRRVCERFNAWGLGSCGRAWHPPSFRSWAHAYDYYARFLMSRWPSARSPYDYHGYCVDRYGNACPTWARDVAWNMDRLGFGPSVRYGR